jgi:hypothetical protein
MPICFDECSTIDQTAQSLKVSRLIFPLFDTDRRRRRSLVFLYGFLKLFNERFALHTAKPEDCIAL